MKSIFGFVNRLIFVQLALHLSQTARPLNLRIMALCFLSNAAGDTHSLLKPNHDLHSTAFLSCTVTPFSS
jgi:hypothetical protein